MIKRILAGVLCVLLLLPAGLAMAEGEEIVIDVVRSSDEYKDMLMDSFDLTVLGKNANVREQLKKVLYLDDVSVDALAYNRIIAAVNNAIQTQSLSENASLDSYTEADLAIAVDLIAEICGALGLDFSIDPSNDSQNEYARVITIKKGNKVLGKINADAKTDVGERATVVWIVLGAVLLVAALGVALWQLRQRRGAVA